VSRAIQVRVSESVVRTVHVEDGVQAPLEMLPVLAADRMAELLAHELAGLGFTRDAMIARRVDDDGVEITVDLAAGTVHVKLAAGAELAEEIEVSARAAAEQRGPVEDRLRDDAMRELDQRLTAQTEALRQKVTAQLERKLGDLRAELEGAIGRATVAALTERAGQLGEIESVVADEAGNVTIKVKL
jgi:hypothetical protein